MRTAVVFSFRYLNHVPGQGHPESPARLRVMLKELKMKGLCEGGSCRLVQPKLASLTEIGMIHDSSYVRFVQQVCRAGGGLLDLEDTTVSRESFKVARLAVGGAIRAVDLVMSGKIQNAFALVRPPGHHAGPSYSMGFCIFNNVAVAAFHLRKNFGLSRIAILDVDAHHGNGTQEIFYTTENVLYVSLHQDPSDFPGTGFVHEVGEASGLGYTVNVPFPFGVDDEIYLKTFNQIVVPILRQYEPQFILVSTGFDNHYSDPVAHLSLSARAYSKIFKVLLRLASKLCMGRLVAILEGGYSLPFLGPMAASVISEMAGTFYSISDVTLTAPLKVRRQAQQIVRQVKAVQSAYWHL